MDHDMMFGGLVDTEDLLEANRRHDTVGHNLSMEPWARYGFGWNDGRLLRKKLLTDKKIRQYEARGFYSAEYREARKRVQEAKRRRKGNFVMADDGRLIYSPMA